MLEIQVPGPHPRPTAETMLNVVLFVWSTLLPYILYTVKLPSLSIQFESFITHPYNHSVHHFCHPKKLPCLYFK